MIITFDPAKDAANLAKHGMPLSAAVEMDMGAALVRVDDRANYGETRYEAIGPLNGRLCVLCSRSANRRSASSACARRTAER